MARNKRVQSGEVWLLFSTRCFPSSRAVKRAGWQKTVWCKSCTSWELSEATCTHILHPSICMGTDRVIMTTFDIPFTSQTRIWLRKPSWEAPRTRWQAEVLLCLLLSTFSSVCLDWMNLYVWERDGWSAGLIFMGLKWHRESVQMWLMTAFSPPSQLTDSLVSAGLC